jgi:hypothetical protein
MCHDNVTPKNFAAHIYTEASVGKQASWAYCLKYTNLQLFSFVNLVLPLLLGLIDYHAVKTWREWSIAPPILYFSIRWRSMVCFTIRPLYPRRNGRQVHIT